MTDADSLLSQARSQLASGGRHRNRAACWLGRAALERVVDDLLAARNEPAPEATMRSRLTILRVAYSESPEIPHRAEYAWARLSDACHHHAFELSPAATEVAHLLDIVEQLAAKPTGRPA